MGKLELEFFFETKKRELLKKIEMTKQKWERTWAKALGRPEAEAELIQLKLEQQLLEKEAMEELQKMERKIEEID